MIERKSMSKKTRFEVFKRDSFTCQYCGAKAPDVVLQVDHIEPVALGGTDALINLTTSCAGCNGGKGATPLSDDSAVAKQRRQMESLQERREQIDMMVEWQKGLTDVDGYTTEKLADFWSELTPGWHLNEQGKQNLAKLIKRFTADVVMAAMRESAARHVVLSGDPPVATSDSQQKAWNYVGRICGVEQIAAKKPHMRRLYWIRGIVRKRCYEIDDSEALQLLDRAVAAGISLDDLEDLAKSHDRWYQWKSNMWRWIGEAEKA